MTFKRLNSASRLGLGSQIGSKFASRIVPINSTIRESHESFVHPNSTRILTNTNFPFITNAKISTNDKLNNNRDLHVLEHAIECCKDEEVVQLLQKSPHLIKSPGTSSKWILSVMCSHFRSQDAKEIFKILREAGVDF